MASGRVPRSHATAMASTRGEQKWHRDASTWFVAVLVALAVTAVVARRRGPAAAEPRPLAIEPSGCAVLFDDGSCERPGDGKLRIWIDEVGAVAVRLDERVLEATAISTEGGTRLAIELPVTRTGGSRLGLEANGRRGAISIRSATTPDWATRAAEAKAKGDHASVITLAQPRADDPDPSVRARALGFVARAALAQNRPVDAEALFRRSIAAAKLARRTSDAVDDGLALSYMFSRAARWVDARAAIAEIEPLAKDYPDGRARLPYYRALASFAFGDIRAAMRELDLARGQAERLGLARLVWNVRNERALALERWGRDDDAIAELRALLATPDPSIAACDRATAAFNLGFAAMVHARRATGGCDGPAPVDDAERWLAQSVDPRCPDAARIAMGHVLLGDVALGRRDVATASAELERVDLTNATLGLRRDHLDLKARVHLARGEASLARDAYERLVALARAEGRIDDERRALEGLGDARAAAGEPDGALAAFTAADALLAASSVLVPIGEAGTFQGARDGATRARIDILAREGRLDDALAVAREARVRLLTSVVSLDRIERLAPDAKTRWEAAVERYRTERRKLDADGIHDWERAASELDRARTEREATLRRLRAALDDALIELPRAAATSLPALDGADVTIVAVRTREDVVVFLHARGDTKLRSARVPAKGDVAAAIVGAAGETLARTGAGATVRVVTSADLACLDLHAVAPLSDAHVVYGLDLPIPAATRPRPPRALVVSDSRDDLPLARDEGALVMAMLAKRGTATHLTGRGATGTAFRESVESATLLHYAGHATTIDGDLALPLASGARFTTADALALRTSPDRVTLSACAAGRIAPSGVALGMGLVQAFVERGASSVVAPTRPVRDELALAFARALVDVDDGTDAGPSRALARVRAASPGADWAAYRVWGP